MKIGYIGLGAKGGALAQRLVAAGNLIVWDIDSAVAAAFGTRAALVARSAAELARQCDVILMCLASSSEVQETIFGPAGLIGGLSAGKLIIDQTDGAPTQTRELAVQLARFGVAMVDAAVSGGVAEVAAGTVPIFASGTETDYHKALPILTAISSTVFHCGNAAGDGQAMRLVNGLLSAGCRLSTLEVVSMGRKLGLSLDALAESLNKGSGRNRTTKVTLHELASGRPAPTDLTLGSVLKDLNQVLRLAMEVGAPTTLTNIVRGLLQIGVSTMGDEAPLERTIDLVEAMAATQIVGAAAVPATRASASAPLASPSPRVGYVGLGTMGGALTRSLMRSRKMSVFDTRREVVRSFEETGAMAAETLPELARYCDVIFLCLPTSDIVREVIFGKGGLAESLAAGTIIVDQTTGDPEKTKAIAAELKEIGVSLVDAPVAGGARGAVAGTIAIMCGGPIEAFAAVRPILESISPHVVFCGETGNGHIAKLVNNAVSTCNCLVTYEAASIAVAYGLGLSDVATVINNSSGWSAASERILPALSVGRATADFRLDLMVKDLKLAGRLAIECGAPMLVARTVCSLYEMGARQQGGSANIDTMSHLFESMAGVRFTDA